MGQVVDVAVREVSDPEVRQFDLDRSLTGMGLLGYLGPEDATGDRPADVAARRLFGIDGVRSVSVYGNVVSVGCTPGFDADLVVAPATEVLANLFVYY